MRDPVCGMTVSTEKNAGSHSHKGTEYLFCSSKCREKFMTDPDAYLHPQPKKSDPTDKSREYTCPMHPDIVQQGPGSCPKCGMDLEPMTASVDDAEEEEAAIRSSSASSPLPFRSKKTSKKAIYSLHGMGITVVMCTGHNLRTVTAVAKELGIDEVHGT